MSTFTEAVEKGVTQTRMPKSILTRVSTVEESRPFRLLLYGPPGSGKTTYAASGGPNSLVIAAEDGTLSIRDTGVDRFTVTGWTDLEDVLYTLRFEDHNYTVVSLDTVTAAQEICGSYCNLEQALLDDTDPRRTYGKIGALVRRMLVEFGTLPDINVVFTAQVRFREDQAGIDAGEYSLVPDVTPAVYKTLTSIPDAIGRTFVRPMGTKTEYGVRFGPEPRSVTKHRNLGLPDELIVPETDKYSLVSKLIERTEEGRK